MSVWENFLSLPRSVIETVQGGTLPYGVFNQLISGKSGTSGTSSTSSTTSSSSDSDDIAFSLLVWLTPTLTVLSGLIVMTILIPISGCIFLCLRKVGHCCARTHNELLSNHNTKFYLSLLIFISFHASLVVGIYFGFISNVRLSSSLTDLTASVNSSLTNGFNFARDTFNELNASIVSQFDIANASATTDLRKVPIFVRSRFHNVFLLDIDRLLVIPALNMIRPSLPLLLTDVTQLLNHLGIVYADVLTVNQSIITLRSRALDINTTLLSLQMATDGFTVACSSDIICEEAVPIVPFLNSVNELEDPLDYNFNGVDLNNIRGQLDDPSQILINIRGLAANEFNGLVLPYNRSSVTTIASALESLQGFLNQEAKGNRMVRDILNSTDTFINSYEIYRSVVFYIIFGLFCALLLPSLSGLVCGLAGYSARSTPFYRTVLSDKGAIIILIGVGAHFSLSGLLLIFSTLLYASSTLLQKVCNDLSPPGYVFITNTIDNRTLWDGSTLLSTLINNQLNSSVDLTARQFLIDCSNNIPLYQALNGPATFDLLSLVLTFNSTERSPYEFGPLVNNVVNEILSNSTRMSIQNLPQSIHSATHLAVYSDRLSQPVLSSDLNDLISELNDLAIVFEFMNMSRQAQLVRNAGDTLVIQVGRSVMRFDNERDRLRTLLSSLETTLMTTRAEVNGFLMSFDTFQTVTHSSFSQAFNPFIDRLFSYFSNYSRQLENSVANVGRCQPVADLYREVHTAVCAGILDGMNGLWCSVLWCVCGSLCLIVAGTTMTIFFRRSGVELGSEGSRYGHSEHGNPNVNRFAQKSNKRRKHTKSGAVQRKPSRLSKKRKPSRLSKKRKPSRLSKKRKPTRKQKPSQLSKKRGGRRSKHSRKGGKHPIHKAPNQLNLQPAEQSNPVSRAGSRLGLQPRGSFGQRRHFRPPGQISEAPSRFSLQQRNYPMDGEGSRFNLLPVAVPSPAYGSLHRRQRDRQRPHHHRHRSLTDPRDPSACLRDVVTEVQRRLRKYIQFDVVVLEKKKHHRPQHYEPHNIPRYGSM